MEIESLQQRNLLLEKIGDKETLKTLGVEEREDNRYLTFSCSSEYAAERVWGKEVLSHAPGAMNLKRADTLNFLWDHDKNIVLGKVVKIWQGIDRRGYCTIKWSNLPKALEYRAEVEDGILDQVSVRYTIDRAEELSDGTILVTNWTPVEISLTSLSVDPSVGIGRSSMAESKIVTVQETAKSVMTVEEKPPVNVEQLRSEAISTERERIAAITALGITHNMQDLAGSAISEGRSLDDFKGTVLEAIANRSPQNPVAAPRPVAPLGLSNKEQKNYSICRAIMAHVDGDWSKAGFERECHNEIAKRSGISAKGLLIPVRDLKVPGSAQRAPYVAGTDNLGGYTVDTELRPQDFIELLRNKIKVIQMGARMMSGLQGNVSIPGQASAASAYWVAEQGSITPGEATFRQIGFTPKTVAALSQYSRNLLLQSSIDVEQFIRADFAQIIALEIDRTALWGSGTAGQPTGVANTAGINSVAIGTNGGAPTWEKIVELETAIADTAEEILNYLEQNPDAIVNAVAQLDFLVDAMGFFVSTISRAIDGWREIVLLIREATGRLGQGAVLDFAAQNGVTREQIQQRFQAQFGLNPFIPGTGVAIKVLTGGRTNINDALSRVVQQLVVERGQNFVGPPLPPGFTPPEKAVEEVEQAVRKTTQQTSQSVSKFGDKLEDLFSKLANEIEDTQLEILKIINRITIGEISNALDGTRSPNPDSFANQLIDSTSSLLDSSADYLQQQLGQREKENRFTRVRKGLKEQFEDLADSAKKAGEALDKIGGQSSSTSAGEPNSNTLPPPPPLLPVPSLPSVRRRNVEDDAINKLQQKLELEGSLLDNQELQKLIIEISNQAKSDRFLVEQELINSQRQFESGLNSDKDLVEQYSFSTPESESEQNIRQVQNVFSDRYLELQNEIQRYSDDIVTFYRLLSDTIPKLKTLARSEQEQQSLINLEANISLLLPQYEQLLVGLAQQANRLEASSDKALEFVTARNKLLEQSVKLQDSLRAKESELVIAEARGTLEAQRKLKLKAEELRLAIAINDLKQNNPPQQAEQLIKDERRKSDINLDNIDLDAQLQEIDLQARLLALQGEVEAKKTRFSLFGNRAQKENAIRIENLRLKRQLLLMNRELAGEPDLLAEFTETAKELNGVNLSRIENEFKSLGKVVEDAFASATQGFFEQVTTSFFEIQSDKELQLLQERLRYAEEVMALEEQYDDIPGKLYHLKSRAKEINEQRLDQITNQFSIFSASVTLARQVLVGFVQELAKVAARAAAAKFLSSIFGGAIGGVGGGGATAVGNDFGSNAAGVSAFVADQGATVGQRQIGDRTTNYLRRLFPGIAQAWNQEGDGARLGVFHTGEELLSRKTGEAGRYQALKQQLGINPLAKIRVFADGGTVGLDPESHILAGFSDYRPRIDLSSLSEGRGVMSKGRSMTFNLHQDIYTPEADSFRLNADQRNQDLIESLQRGFG